MPGNVNGIPHATSTDRLDLWPTTSRNLAQWIDGNMLRDDDPRMTNARPPTAHTHDLGDVTGLAARLAALEYDSGRRALTLPEGITGNIYVQRVGRWVQISIANTAPGEGNITPLETLPPTFSPNNAFQVEVKGGRIEATWGGGVTFYRHTTIYGAGVVTYLPRSPATPTTLPGTPG